MVEVDVNSTKFRCFTEVLYMCCLQLVAVLTLCFLSLASQKV